MLGAQKGLEHKRSRVKKAFQCTHTMGGSAPSLHRESTDSLMIIICVRKPLLSISGNYNNIATVAVEVSDSAAAITLRWLDTRSVYPNLIQVFCSDNSMYRRVVLCGQTRGVDGENVTLPVKGLNSSSTYFYRLKVSGEQPFVVQGNFTTMPQGMFMLAL